MYSRPSRRPANLREFGERFAPELLLGGLCVAGTIAAFRTGAPDFRVFSYAGKLIAEGAIDRVYAESPDRFLYAPGAAVLFAPFAFVPIGLALAGWCALKTWGLYTLLPRLRSAGFPSAAVFLAILAVARPLLIDFRYGNLNAFLLLLAMHFVFSLDLPTARSRAFAASIAMGILAFLKLLFLPIGLLALRRGRARPLGAFALGALFLCVLPLVVTRSGFADAYVAWLTALREKGIPLETHNQSFLAFLFRAFGGVASRSLYLGGDALPFGARWFDSDQVFWIYRVYFLAWLCGIAILVRRIARTPIASARELRYSFLFLSVIWVSSHLIWKPYFVLGFPAVLVALERLLKDRRWKMTGLLIALTLVPGLDTLGAKWATVHEALSPQLWLHFAWIAIAFRAVDSAAQE